MVQQVLDKTNSDRDVNDFQLVLTQGQGKTRPLENSSTASELLADGVTKVSLRLVVEAESKTGAVLTRRKKINKHKSIKRKGGSTSETPVSLSIT